MRAARKRKLGLVILLLLILSIVAALVLYALRQNISLFFTPSQIVLKEAPLGKPIRLGGMVKERSIVRKEGTLEVQFVITDFNQSITVHYQGILPDLFREGQGVVTEGVLKDFGYFQATQVLAKHDENYMPPEVKSSLAKTRGNTA